MHHKKGICINKGSISPNNVRQAKRRKRTAFGEKFAIQFHQQFCLIFPVENSKLKFPEFVRCLPNAVHNKRLWILRANISPQAVRHRIFAWQNCWWNRPKEGFSEKILTGTNLASGSGAAKVTAAMAMSMAMQRTNFIILSNWKTNKYILV